MAHEIKSLTLNLKVTPSFKKRLINLAQADHRSITSLIETLVLDYEKRKKPTKIPPPTH